jgi:hypothetical protein
MQVFNYKQESCQLSFVRVLVRQGIRFSKKILENRTIEEYNEACKKTVLLPMCGMI